jgi:hypothetical protein
MLSDSARSPSRQSRRAVNSTVNRASFIFSLHWHPILSPSRPLAASTLSFLALLILDGRACRESDFTAQNTISLFSRRDLTALRREDGQDSCPSSRLFRLSTFDFERRRADSCSHCLVFLLSPPPPLARVSTLSLLGQLSHLSPQRGSLDSCINSSNFDFDNHLALSTMSTLTRRRADTRLRAYSTF